MDFGKYAVIEPVTYHLEQEPDWWWRFKPPTSGDELVINRFINAGKVLEDEEEAQPRVVPVTWLEIAYKELALTFAGTNIPSGKDDPTPLIKEDASVRTVEQALERFPQELVMELWEALADVAPGWGAGKKEPREPEKKE